MFNYYLENVRTEKKYWICFKWIGKFVIAHSANYLLIKKERK